MESSLTELLQGFREKTIKLQKVKAPTLWEKATENKSQLFQAIALVGVMVFQWFMKNREQGAALRQQEAQAGGEPNTPVSTDAAESSADPHKED